MVTEIGRDGDGCISSVEELGSIGTEAFVDLGNSGTDGSEEEMRDMLKVFDANKDGKI